jgi:hypothetical protein
MVRFERGPAEWALIQAAARQQCSPEYGKHGLHALCCADCFCGVWHCYMPLQLLLLQLHRSARFGWLVWGTFPCWVNHCPCLP